MALAYLEQEEPPREGLKWLKKAAEHDPSGHSMRYLGDYFSGRWGGPCDEFQALFYYTKGAHLADLEPVRAAIAIYRDTQGVESDAEEAERWEMVRARLEQ